MVSKANLYLDLLRKMEEDTGNIEMSAIITLDGLVMASTISDHINKEALAAYCAAAFKTAAETMHELTEETSNMLLFESANHRVVILRLSADVVLGALTGKKAKTGIVLLEMQKTAEKISELLNS